MTDEIEYFYMGESKREVLPIVSVSEETVKTYTEDHALDWIEELENPELAGLIKDLCLTDLTCDDFILEEDSYLLEIKKELIAVLLKWERIAAEKLR